MKKIILFSILTLCTLCSIQAQLKVDSLGKVQIFGKLEAHKHVLINDSTTKNLEIRKRKLNTNSVSYNMYAHSQTRSNINYNIYAEIYDSLQANSTKKYYGVFSSVTGTRSNYSYGVLGRVGWKGVGVYGTNNSTLPVISQSYAGYFSGATHVQGNLTVSGTVNGVLLSPSAAPSSQQQLDEDEATRAIQTSRLQHLDIHAYYLDAPQINTMEIDETNADCKEGEMRVGMPEPNCLEKQIYAKQHYGLDAEQLEEVFPDLVYEDEDGTKSINYVEMVPVLVQAIKEMKAEINELKGNNASMKAKKTTSINAAENVQFLSLGQNKPNPFSTATDTEVFVPETVQTAFLYVYDLQGKKVQQVDITARGKQTVNVNAAELAEGMYLYSLIADGKVVETRRMIVEK